VQFEEGGGWQGDVGEGGFYHGDNDVHDYNDVNSRAVSLVALVQLKRNINSFAQ
jgi:hypothetical protein